MPADDPGGAISHTATVNITHSQR